jgi:hypothetical protein
MSGVRMQFCGSWIIIEDAQFCSGVWLQKPYLFIHEKYLKEIFEVKDL